MNEPARNGPRASSIHIEAKKYWCSHSLFGKLVGIFLNEIDALVASEEYDVQLIIASELSDPDEERIHILKAVFIIAGHEQIERFIAYDSIDEKYLSRATKDEREAFFLMSEMINNYQP